MDTLAKPAQTRHPVEYLLSGSKSTVTHKIVVSNTYSFRVYPTDDRERQTAGLPRRHPAERAHSVLRLTQIVGSGATSATRRKERGNSAGEAFWGPPLPRQLPFFCRSAEDSGGVDKIVSPACRLSHSGRVALPQDEPVMRIQEARVR